MKHARDDYNRIQDPAVDDPSLLAPGTTAIGVDEPVFILRARDVSAPAAIRHWADLNVLAGGDANASRLAYRQAAAMEAWKGERKPADLPRRG